MIRKALLATVMAVSLPLSAGAVEPDEILADSALEARAREISKDLRCVVCQNQDIDSSNAGVARDLRLLIRERLVAGDTDAEVIEFVRIRYGNFVLLKPPFNGETLVLWLAPAILILLGTVGAAVTLTKARKRRAADELSRDEEAVVAEMLARNKGSAT